MAKVTRPAISNDPISAPEVQPGGPRMVFAVGRDGSLPRCIGNRGL